MPFPLPAANDELLAPPDAVEAQFLARGVATAIAPIGGLTLLQGVLMQSMFEAMTGHDVDLGQRPIDPVSFADGMLDVARQYAQGHLGLAAVDFERNGFTADWSSKEQAAPHTSRELGDAWALSVDDPELAARWTALEQLPAGTLGRSITEFYRARGFHDPGMPGSASPLLAQHDWAHIVADYGTKVESELEVFAFIARANDDAKGFSLLAMVVSLFETGYLEEGAGLFEAFPGQLSHDGVAVRVADAMRRGALVSGSVDFMAVDWFEIADLSTDEARRRFGVVEKPQLALDAGSVGPWQPGGITEIQWNAGHELAATEGRAHDSFGASVGPG